MRILVMGGTRFVGRPLVELLQSSGHALTLFTRGRNPVPAGVEHLGGDRSSEEGLTALEGRSFDVIVDSSGRSVEDTRRVIERTGARDDIMAFTMEHMSIQDKISEILERLAGVQDGIEFEALFDNAPERIEIITTFLAILELIKMQALKVYQNANFGKLFVYAVTDDEATVEPTSEELPQE